jgi:hypothetical protein
MATILDMLRSANSNLQSLPQPQGFGSKTCFALATLRLRNAICLLEKGYPIGANADTLLDLTPVEEVPNYQPPTSTTNLADLTHRVLALEAVVYRLQAYAASMPILCAQWQAPNIAGLDRRQRAVEQRGLPPDITVDTTVPTTEHITRDQLATDTTNPPAATPAHDPSPSAAVPA